jgi:hypothetical protein
MVHDYRLDQVQVEVPPVVSADDVPFQLPVAEYRKRASSMTSEAPAAKRSKEEKHASAQAAADESQKKKKKKKKKNKDKDKASPKTNKEGQSSTLAPHEGGIKAKFGRMVKGMSLPKAFSKGKQGKRPPNKPKSAYRDKNKGKSKSQKRPAQQSTQSSPGDKNWQAMKKEGKLSKAPSGGSTKRRKPKKSKKASKSDA